MAPRFRLITFVMMLALGASTVAAQTPFELDVATAIQKGLDRLAAQGAFTTTSSAGDAAGLVALALMEKRQAASFNSPPQGYAGAAAGDQLRMRDIVTFIINNHANLGFYAYRDGADLMALSVFLRTGGPNDVAGGRIMTPSAALLQIFDRTVASQNATTGYWCYFNGGCQDSSTTQLVMAGLSAARSIFQPSGFLPDATRLAALNTAADRAEAAYNSVTTALGDCDAQLSTTEKGHGYNRGNCNSLQQTASGTWIQLVGGSDVNSAGVQAYLEWIRNRYDYPDVSNANGGWGQSAYYYLWSSMKAYTFIEESGIAATGSNLEPADLGKLPPASAPANASRRVNRDPTVDPRVPSFGAGGPGYYGAEAPGWYYDYAYELLLDQDAAGNFNSTDGAWEGYSNQAYAILILENSVGGGCLDGNSNGVCDSDEPQCKSNTTQTFAHTINNQMTSTISFAAAVTEGTGQALRINVTSVMQDERTRQNVLDAAPDATLANNNTVNTDLRVRKQRGTSANAGDGRFYTVNFTATDPDNNSCSGVLKIIIPSAVSPSVDGGSLYNSFQIN